MLLVLAAVLLSAVALSTYVTHTQAAYNPEHLVRRLPQGVHYRG